MSATKHSSNPRLLGVIEGTWALRRNYADFLLEQDLNSYLYCPKSDAWLRKNWQQDWPGDIWGALAETAAHYRGKALNFGVGLSPFALYQQYDAAARRALRDKVRRIDALGGNILAILFDDMPGDCADLAARQAEIIADVKAWTAAEAILACPTYYSFDPVLEQFFGSRPDGYWESLGELLDSEVGLFWTGNRVCSETISRADIQQIAALLGRAPVLWDNYPVNDGAKASRFLHLEPLPGRDPDLPDAVAGHFCNPMNQGSLSRYPLTGLAMLYGARPTALEELVSAKLAGRLLADQPRFEKQGLDGMSGSEREELAVIYSGYDEAAADEVADWLRGEYSFDPACLTG